MPTYFSRVLFLASAVFLVFTFTMTAQAKGLPNFADLAEQAGPAVVNISTETSVDSSGSMEDFFRNQPPGSPFKDFFEQFEKFFGMPEEPEEPLEPEQRQQPFKRRAAGSGFIISEDGYIVTNNHVAGEADVVRVNLQGHTRRSESYEAKVVGRDKETDLALLKIEAKEKLPVLRFGDSDDMHVGEWVMAIGNPFGLAHTVTAGIISAKSRIIGNGPFDDFIQTDASINPGNSGGPLLNLDGEVVGINTAIVAAGQGIGFAIPSNMAKRIIAQLKENKKVTRGWLGVSIQDVDANAAKALGLKKPEGALISQVFEGHPADKAGLRSGDVVTAIDDKTVKDSNELLRKIAALKPGDTASITLWRKGKLKTITVILGERDMDSLAQDLGSGDWPQKELPEPQSVDIGLLLRPVTKADLEVLGMDQPQGLLVEEVEPGSAAMQNGVMPGDVILEANQTEINSVEAFTQALKAAENDKGVVMLLLKRGGRNLFRTIPLE